MNKIVLKRIVFILILGVGLCLLASAAYAYDETPVFNSLESAAAYVRQQLVARERPISVELSATPGLDEQELWDQLWSMALAHTGVPTEGDYIKHQLGSWGGDCQYRPESQNYYFSFWITYTVGSSAEYEREVDEAVRSVIKGLNVENLKTDYEKLCAIYDYECQNIKYASDVYGYRASAHSAIIEKEAVCEGYAVLLYRLLLEAGVDNRIIGGEKVSSGIAHAWNIVKLNDLYYNVDATWDAPRFQSGYKYFLLCDSNFDDHKRWDDDYNRWGKYLTYGAENISIQFPLDIVNYSERITLGTSKVTVSGTIISYGSSTAEVSVRLLSNGVEKFNFSGPGNSVSYIMLDVTPGKYTLEISKADHVSRSFDVTIGAVNIAQNFTVYLLGDVNEDSSTNIQDVVRLLNHVNNSNVFSYKGIGDINGDGKINIQDVIRLLNHVNNSDKLY